METDHHHHERPNVYISVNNSSIFGSFFDCLSRNRNKIMKFLKFFLIIGLIITLFSFFIKNKTSETEYISFELPVISETPVQNFEDIERYLLSITSPEM